MDRAGVEEILQINKTRFFASLKEYRRDPEKFSIAYERQTHNRLSAEVETAIAKELLREKELIENPELPITNYNYTARWIRSCRDLDWVCPSPKLWLKARVARLPSKARWVTGLQWRYVSLYCVQRSLSYLNGKLSPRSL